MSLHPLIRCSAVMTFVIASIALAQSPELAAAIADRDKYQPVEHQQYLRYLSVHNYADESLNKGPRTDLVRALKLAVASDTRQQVLELCVPVEVPNTDLYRIDLYNLGWRIEDWQEIAGFRNPYTLELDPLVVRGDKFLELISDQSETDSYVRFMFHGDNLPKTVDDVRKFFSINNTKDFRFGMIEGDSKVNTQGTRWIENRPSSRGYYYFTEDSRRLGINNDPLEHVEVGPKHDGEEHIIGLRKMSSIYGKEGTLQWYFLANGKGELVGKAAVDLVRDHTEFRGFAEIRNPGSCIQCHDHGLNEVKRNEYREAKASGVKFFEQANHVGENDQFHGVDLPPVIASDNLKYMQAAVLTCDCTATDAANSFKAAISRYDAPLHLEDVARELDSTTEETNKVLIGNIPHRLDSLNKGNEPLPDGKRTQRGVLSRTAFEQYAIGLYASVHNGAEQIVATTKVHPDTKVKTKQKSAQPVYRNGGRY